MAAEHAALAAEHAPRHDREGSFPFEVFEAMRSSGFLAATIPKSHGGLGLTSIHDLAAGLCELGRADGSTSIAANMHLVFGLGIRWLRQRELSSSTSSASSDSLDAALRQLGRGSVAMGNVTEAGTDIAHPFTEAARAQGGWRLSGRKIFGTLAPIADWFVVSCRVRRTEGDYVAAYALVPRGTPGQKILNNWDGLGMRASGSHDVIYEDCLVPDHRLFVLDRRWGTEDVASRALGIIGNIGLLGTYLGIAEAARDHAVADLTKRAGGDDRPSRLAHDSLDRLIAEIEVSLTVMRAVLQRTTRFADRLLWEPSLSEALAGDLSAEFQSAKLVVNTEAIAVVDRALTLSGGTGYTSAHPLSRLYRDVRAGPFMQPYSPKEAYGHIARPNPNPWPS